jgi:hypothetical protein
MTIDPTIGTHRMPFKFGCPFCFARPGKPCVQTKGRNKGKTCKTHSARWLRYKKATAPRDQIKAVWSSHYESNRSKH